jgi:Zn-dependent peptidase ImmA (M78 family)
MHELYHYLKRHPSLSPTMMCKPKWMRSGDAQMHVSEIESNAFSGAWLLPEFLLRKRCEVSPVSLEVPRQIEKEFDVSILTSAIRFCELSSERCAAVFSKNA